jgi:hypothetical protein
MGEYVYIYTRLRSVLYGGLNIVCHNSQITHQRNALYFHFILFIYIYPWCEVNVVYEPPEDDLVKAETYVGVEE